MLLINQKQNTMKNFKAIAHYNRQTEKAIQLSFDWKEKSFINVWFPKSQVTFLHDNNYGGCEVSIPFWLLYKNEDKLQNVYDNNSNSTWCDIFRKQDANGLSEYGYAL